MKRILFGAKRFGDLEAAPSRLPPTYLKDKLDKFELKSF